MHAGINKCIGGTADHVKKHLGAVSVFQIAYIVHGLVLACGICACVGITHRPHPHDHPKIKPGPLIHHTFEYKTSFTKVKNMSDKVTGWSF